MICECTWDQGTAIRIQCILRHWAYGTDANEEITLSTCNTDFSLSSFFQMAVVLESLFGVWVNLCVCVCAFISLLLFLVLLKFWQFRVRVCLSIQHTQPRSYNRKKRGTHSKNVEREGDREREKSRHIHTRKKNARYMECETRPLLFENE